VNGSLRHSENFCLNILLLKPAKIPGEVLTKIPRKEPFALDNYSSKCMLTGSERKSNSRCKKFPKNVGPLR
jgi:hypothetical protein